jgi:HNH endonuclease
MPFNERLKLRIKRKANFTCCWCREQRNRVDIHHIIPKSEEGPDTEDNAAPLCGSCHDLYGNNRDHRKEIRDRRDHWYELCADVSVLHKGNAIACSVLQSEPILSQVATLAGKLTEALSSGSLRGYSDSEARQMLSDLNECRGRLREHGALLQKLRDLENSTGWLLSQKGVFETIAERNRTW